ncbi:hypothetical protein NDA13_000904 [Ustilago tritici]|nr:hypothetical protein NDA13_000904 [Ustilago tritici]
MSFASAGNRTGTDRPMPPDLFADVRYFINVDVDAATQDEIRSLLSLGGAQHHDDASIPSGSDSSSNTANARFRLGAVTHVLALSEHFPEYQHCIEPTLPEQAPAAKRPIVVTPEWVRRSAHLGVRLKEDRFSCRSAMIFSGLCVAASKSELSKADRELISSIVSAYGGLWREDHLFDVNVFLTTSISSAKLNKVINTPGKQTICVAPQWISDSWRVQKLLPLDSYQFHLGQSKLPPCFAGRTASGSPLTSPRRDRVAMSLIKDSKSNLVDTAGDKSNGTSRDKHVFRGQSVLLARDVCRASEQQLRSLEHFIRTSGGTVRRAPKDLNGIAQAVRNSDFVVCRYREVQEFREAIRQKTQVGNLMWLINVVSNDVFSDPREEPLHFPVPRQGIPEFHDATITISNYRGSSRQYLTKMIKLMGATFSGTLTAQTSLCVAANLKSEKTNKAKEWKVPVVNHNYIVDSFLAWAPVERAKLKYIDFPEAVDYNLDVGETRVTDESLGPWIDDAINNDEPEDMPTSDPVSPSAGHYAAVEPSAAEASLRAQETKQSTPAPVENNDAENRTARADSTGLEPTSPPATPSLSAAPRYDDLSTTTTSSDRPSSPSPSEDAVDNSILSQRGTKRSRMPILQDSLRQPTSDAPGLNADRDVTQKSVLKKLKIAAAKRIPDAQVSSPTISNDDNSTVGATSDDAPLRVATSNYKLKKADENKLKTLGIEIVDNIELANVLVTPKISRSPKMLYAIASGNIAIISPDWILACLKKRQLVQLQSESTNTSSSYSLVDKEGEKTYGIILADILKRRKTEYRHGIYAGHKFWLGRGVDENGSFSTLIEAAGGKVLPVPFGEEKLLSDPDHYHLVVDEDHTIEWRDLIGLPTISGKPLKLYKKQLITDCIFEQQPRWDRHLVDTARVRASSSGTTPVKRGRASAGGSANKRVAAR